MEMTYPLKTKKEIDLMKAYLKSTNVRSFLMYMVGISSALRISDILNLHIYQIWQDGKPAREITVREKKTGKTKIFATSKNLQDAIALYMTTYNYPREDSFVFISRQGDNKPISRQRAVQILDSALEACNISVNFGSHGMRKTFAYHLWKKGVDIAYIMRILNHSSVRETLRYLGIEQSELNDIYVSLNL